MAISFYFIWRLLHFSTFINFHQFSSSFCCFLFVFNLRFYKSIGCITYLEGVIQWSIYRSFYYQNKKMKKNFVFKVIYNTFLYVLVEKWFHNFNEFWYRNGFYYPRKYISFTQWNGQSVDHFNTTGFLCVMFTRSMAWSAWFCIY